MRPEDEKVLAFIDLLDDAVAVKAEVSAGMHEVADLIRADALTQQVERAFSELYGLVGHLLELQDRVDATLQALGRHYQSHGCEDWPPAISAALARCEAELAQVGPRLEDRHIIDAFLLEQRARQRRYARHRRE
jgi:hypothetical protein